MILKSIMKLIELYLNKRRILSYYGSHFHYSIIFCFTFSKYSVKLQSLRTKYDTFVRSEKIIIVVQYSVEEKESFCGYMFLRLILS